MANYQCYEKYHDACVWGIKKEGFEHPLTSELYQIVVQLNR